MPIHAGWIEKRQSERVDASLKVSYTLVPRSELASILTNPSYKDSTTDRLPELSRKSVTVNAVTRDLSLTGMSLVGTGEFPEDMALEVNLYLPGYPAPLTVLAEIIRAQEEGGSNGSTYRAGIKILAINRGDVSRLDRFLLAEKMKKHEK